MRASLPLSAAQKRGGGEGEALSRYNKHATGHSRYLLCVPRRKRITRPPPTLAQNLRCLSGNPGLSEEKASYTQAGANRAEDTPAERHRDRATSQVSCKKIGVEQVG